MLTPKPCKVLLVNYAGFFLCANTFIPDNSLGTLAAMLRSDGIPVEIVDLQSPQTIGSMMDHTSHEAAEQLVGQLDHGCAPEGSLVRSYQSDRRRGEEAVLAIATQGILRKIAEEGIGVVGFKLWVGDGITLAIQMAEAIRATFPGVLLVAGGPAVQYCGHYLRELTRAFDHLVAGEGEYAIVALARSQAAGRHSRKPGSTDTDNELSLVVRAELSRRGLPARISDDMRMPRTRNLDTLPFPTYDRSTYPGIDDFYRLRVLDETRGCFNRCAFCTHSHLSGQGTRKRCAASVVDEMERLQRTQDVSHFRLSGSNPPWRLVARIAREILRRGLKVQYSIFASLNNVNPANFATLRESGLCSIFFGVESGDSDLLLHAHHKTNGSQSYIVHVCETAMREGIFLALSFMVPSPFETDHTKRASLDLIGRIFAHHSRGSVMVAPAFLSPGSRWWEQMDHFGFEFARGVDPRSYIVNGVQTSSDYLLPVTMWSDFGYLLAGKPAPQLLAECEAFGREVQQLGVLTNVDDTAFMLALMGGLEPGAYKARTVRRLILGGARELGDHVRDINANASRSKEATWVAPRSRANAA